MKSGEKRGSKRSAAAHFPPRTAPVNKLPQDNFLIQAVTETKKAIPSDGLAKSEDAGQAFFALSLVLTSAFRRLR